jgi:membrane protein
MTGVHLPPAKSTRAAVRLFHVVKFCARAVWRGVIEFYNSENLTFAASIAYYSLLSLFPFMLLLLSILSRTRIGPMDVNLLSIVASTLPSKFDFLMTRVQELTSAQFKVSVLSAPLLLWAAMGVFGAITSAINHAWGVEKPHGFWTHKLIAFIMLLASGTLLVTALLLVSAIQFVEARWFSGILQRFPGLIGLTGALYRNMPTPMFMLVAGTIYYYVPNAKVRLRDVWLGAVIAGLLWRATFSGFSWYVRDFSRFSVHGSVAAVVVFLIWIYLCAVVLLYGAEVSAAYARLRKHLPQQVPAAETRDPTS